MTIDDELTALVDSLADAVVQATIAGALATGWSAFELRHSLDDLAKLKDGEDACYDRPGVGWAYAGWYHPARTQDAVRMLRPALAGRGGRVHLVDLGCGTGATLWALSALLTAASRARVEVPAITVQAVDASVPMQVTAQQMWRHLRADPLFGAAAVRVDVTWTLKPWTDLTAHDAVDVETWVVAGHLFDSSDRNRLTEVCASVVSALDAVGATRCVTCTSQSKRAIADAAARQLASSDWAAAPIDSRTWWTGGLPDLRAARRAAGTRAEFAHPFLNGLPGWSTGCYALSFERSAPRERLLDVDAGLPFRLDPVQAAAAEPKDRMTAILGTAGSGKSWVLVDRIVRTAEGPHPAGEPHRILVTTFNQRLIAQLSEWLGERLAASTLAGLERITNGKKLVWRDPEFDDRPRISLVHIDSLCFGPGTPTVHGDSSWRHAMQRQLERPGVLPPNVTAAQQEVLTPAYLLDEVRTVIEGRPQVRDLATYRASRSGRRRRLSAKQTELIWDVCHAPRAPEGFPHARRRWLEGLRASDADPPYTHLFVDECQDMTLVDFEAFTYLVPDPRHIVVTGDEAQAVLLGSTFQRPRSVKVARGESRDGAASRQWEELRLSGSYRLPVRICEAIQPIAEALRDERGNDQRGVSHGELPVPTKAAVLGCRPIVVAADAVADVIGDVWSFLEPLFDEVPRGRRRTMIEAERRPTLVPPPEWTRQRGTMLEVKGLEFDLVVWQTDAPIPAEESLLSWIYTILTRSRSILVLVAAPDTTPTPIADALSLLRRDRLLIWDETAQRAWNELVERGTAEV